MNLEKKIKNLCKPAYFYLVLSCISIFVMIIENMGKSNSFCFGKYEKNVTSTTMVFIYQILYTIFWTYVLNKICLTGYKNLSWFIVLLPLIIFFLIIILYFLDAMVIDINSML